MNISLTKDEYRNLVDLLYLADWVIFSHHAEKNTDHEKYEIVKNKILSYSKDMGCEDIVFYDNELHGYFETRDYEEKMQEQFIHEYDNQAFWDEFVSRLAIRDLAREFGEEKCTNMDVMERLSKVCTIEEKYELEFEQNGLDNIVVNTTVE